MESGIRGLAESDIDPIERAAVAAISAPPGGTARPSSPAPRYSSVSAMSARMDAAFSSSLPASKPLRASFRYVRES